MKENNLIFVMMVILTGLVIVSYFGIHNTNQKINELEGVVINAILEVEEVIPEPEPIQFGVTPYNIGSLCSVAISDSKLLISKSYKNSIDIWFYDGYFMKDGESVGAYHGLIHDFVKSCEKPIDNP